MLMGHEKASLLQFPLQLPSKSSSPFRLLCIVQVLGEDANAAHTGSTEIKPLCPADEPIHNQVIFCLQGSMEGLATDVLRHTVPRDYGLCISALKHWDTQHRKVSSQYILHPQYFTQSICNRFTYLAGVV